MTLNREQRKTVKDIDGDEMDIGLVAAGFTAAVRLESPDFIFCFNPSQAREVANHILKLAEEIEPEKVEEVSQPAAQCEPDADPPTVTVTGMSDRAHLLVVQTLINQGKAGLAVQYLNSVLP